MNSDLILKYQEQIQKDYPSVQMKKIGEYIVEWYNDFRRIAILTVTDEGYNFEKTEFYKKKKRF